MNDTPWYTTFFGKDYLRLYTPFLPAEKTAQEVAGILNLLNLPTGCTILDLCCGNGRHAIPLARHGYQITGQDLNKDFLQQAQDECKSQDIQAQWIEGDMRNIPFANKFHAIINIFTSFGYLANEEEDTQVLQQIYNALKPGGLFLLETLPQFRVMRTFSPYGIIRYDDGLIVLEERRIDLRTSRNEVRITILYPDGNQAEYHQSIRLYTLTELTRMLASVGLETQAYYGGLDGSALTTDSRLVIVSRKAS